METVNRNEFRLRKYCIEKPIYQTTMQPVGKNTLILHQQKILSASQQYIKNKWIQIYCPNIGYVRKIVKIRKNEKKIFPSFPACF